MTVSVICSKYDPLPVGNLMGNFSEVLCFLKYKEVNLIVVQVYYCRETVASQTVPRLQMDSVSNV